MLRSVLLCGALALTAAAGAGCADTTPSSTAQSGMAMSNTEYVSTAAESDQFEIQEGRLAAAQSQNPSVRDFGNQMVRDHTLTSQALMAAVARSGMAPPPAPPLRPDHQQMLAQLQNLSGPAFDRAYVGQQVTAHQEALSLNSAYAQGGSDPNLRAAAGSATPMIRRHLETIRQMQASMGGM